MHLSRRQFVTTIAGGLGVLAGCMMGGQPDIQLRNETETELTGEITVTRISDEERLLADTFTLASGPIDDPDTEEVYRNVVDTETARVSVTVSGGPASSREFTDDRADALTLDVAIRAEDIQFSLEAA